MTSHDETFDHEELIKRSFDPRDFNAWKTKSSEDVIKIIVHEIRRENVKLLTWLNWLKTNVSKDITQGEERVTIPIPSSSYHVDDLLSGLLKSTRVTDHLLNFLSAYSEELDHKE